MRLKLSFIGDLPFSTMGDGSVSKPALTAALHGLRLRRNGFREITDTQFMHRYRKTCQRKILQYVKHFTLFYFVWGILLK